MNWSQHQIASTNQHPITMINQQRIAHGAGRVLQGWELRERWSKNDVEALVPPEDGLQAPVRQPAAASTPTTEKGQRQRGQQTEVWRSVQCTAPVGGL